MWVKDKLSPTKRKKSLSFRFTYAAKKDQKKTKPDKPDTRLIYYV